MIFGVSPLFQTGWSLFDIFVTKTLNFDKTNFDRKVEKITNCIWIWKSPPPVQGGTFLFPYLMTQASVILEIPWKMTSEISTYVSTMLLKLYKHYMHTASKLKMSKYA